MGQSVFGGGSGGGGNPQSTFMMMMLQQQQQQQMQQQIAQQQNTAQQNQVASVQQGVSNDTWDMLRQFGARGAMSAAGHAAPALGGAL